MLLLPLLRAFGCRVTSLSVLFVVNFPDWWLWCLCLCRVEFVLFGC